MYINSAIIFIKKKSEILSPGQSGPGIEDTRV